MLLQGIAAVVTKIASASTVAQVATGLGVTLAGVAGAGVVGVLPGPVQDGVAGAVESITPFDLPDSADDRVTGVDDPVRHAADPTQPTSDPTAASPSEIPVVSVPAAPSTTHEVEVEAGDDDGIHQHRGGRTETGVDDAGPSSAAQPAAPTTADAPEVEDHHGGDDDSGSHGGGDSSGHGGGDD